jgi:uncharacterized protein (TIGR00369 family)
MSDVKNWVEQSAYASTLGIRAESITAEGAILQLPFREGNSNPGGALHGGVYASLSIIGAHATARTALGADIGPFHTVGIQINYLSAAINEGVNAHARLLKRGKELAFVEVTCVSDAGKDVAHASLMVRGRKGADSIDGPVCQSAVIGDEPGKMGPAVTKMVPFIHERGIVIEHMTDGQARLTMPWIESHGDSASLGTHEGAALALLDTAGAMAGWAQVGQGPHKASTPTMQAQILAAPPAQDLVAYARVAYQDNEILYSDVEVAGKDDQKIYARGCIPYRIVVGS